MKIQELAITISNTKSVYKISAQQWIEIGGDSSGESSFGTDFMMHPNKLYKISFAGEQCQFSENSMLSVSRRLQKNPHCKLMNEQIILQNLKFLN